MNIQEITKENMEAMQTLADTNVKIGEAKGSLEAIKAIEIAYLEAREKKAVSVVQKVLEDSKALLSEAATNYLKVKELSATASSFARFLIEAHDSFKQLVVKFEEKGILWEEQVKRQEDEFVKLRNDIKRDRILLDNDQAALDTRRKQMDVEKRKLDDDRQTLDRAIKRLKEGKI